MKLTGGILTPKTEVIMENKYPYLLFEAAGLSMAVPYKGVREVISYIKPTPVPGLPDYIAGIINYFGQVCPVVSLNMAIGESEPDITRKTCIIIFESTENNSILIGMPADSFSGSAKISPEEIGAYDGSVKGIKPGCITGYTDLNGVKMLIFQPFEFFGTLDYISLK